MAANRFKVVVLKRPGESPENVHLGEELKSGGAGSVFSIDGDATRVVKIYNDVTLKKDGATYQEKIECMLGSAPNVPTGHSPNGDVIQLAWPLASAFTLKGEFIGFAMPMVDLKRTTELEFVLSKKQAEKAGLPHHLGIQVSLAYNLSSIVNSIHARGHAIVDLKPVNLKFYIKELFIAVLDCDGFYVNLPGKTASALQITPDYVAPEFQDAQITKPEHQDRFALAVIIFKLLNFGIHPYAGIAQKGGNIPNDLERKIKDGLYPYGLIPHKKVSPVPASTHESLPSELRELFDRSFIGSPSLRPTAEEWATVLRGFAEKSRGLLEKCGNNHFQFKGMPCATCLREQVVQSASSKKQQQQKKSSATSHTSTFTGQATQSSRAFRQPAPPRHIRGASSSSSAIRNFLRTGWVLTTIGLWMLFSFSVGFYVGIMFWIVSIAIAIPILIYTSRHWTPVRAVILALLLGVGLTFPALMATPFIPGAQKVLKAVTSIVTPIPDRKNENRAIEDFLAALGAKNAVLANEKFSISITEYLATNNPPREAYSLLLQATLNLAKLNVAQGNSEEAMRVLIHARKGLLSESDRARYSSAENASTAIQINALLASMFLAGKKYPEAADAAREALSIKSAVLSEEDVQSINNAHWMLGSSMLIKQHYKEASVEFGVVNEELLPNQDRLYLKLLKLISNTLAGNYKDPFSEARIQLQGVELVDMSSVLSRVNAMSVDAKDTKISLTAENLWDAVHVGWIGLSFGSDNGEIVKQSCNPIDSVAQMFNTYGDADGLIITGVVSPSPASQAGIKLGDRLLEISGQSLSDMNGAYTLMKNYKPGEQLTVKVLHGCRERDYILQTGARPYSN